jgi:hypothetical protein
MTVAAGGVSSTASTAAGSATLGAANVWTASGNGCNRGAPKVRVRQEAYDGGG